MSERFVLVTGCSGGGKSSLLEALGARGCNIVPEPGRRIVDQEQRSGGTALPWVDGEAFARRAIAMALADRRTTADLPPGWVFFDRGLIDAASALETVTGEAVLERLAAAHRYHRQVFLAPPWPEIHTLDAARRHGLEAGIEEYERLAEILPRLDYQCVLLPKVSVAQRVAFVLQTLDGVADMSGPAE